MNDIVYILREGIDTDEIVYSVRSVVKNFPHNKIWFITGKPKGIEPDGFIEFRQKGISPWEKTQSAIYKACCTKEISEDFWLFNDDFFIMKKVEGETYYDKTLQKWLESRENGYIGSLYMLQMRREKEALQSEGFTTLNYAVHMPMLINKNKGKHLIEVYPKMVLFRSAYGNMWKVGGRQKKDCKVSEANNLKRMDYISTTDKSWQGEVGDYIRSQFPDKCKYEV